MQIIEEKKSGESIDVDNKNNQKDFIKIIKDFLNSNFYYISQIYLVYKFLSEIKEPFSEQLKKKMNEIIEENLQKNTSKKLIENTFDKIFENFEEFIFQNKKNRKLYEKEKFKLRRSVVNYNNDLNNKKINYKNIYKSINLDCPNPYINN